MKLFFYCQHILGVGHFFRSLEITKALAEHDVVLVTGGAEIDIRLPAHVRNVVLPGLMMDRRFSFLFPSQKGRDLETVKAERKERLLEAYRRECPDVFLIELYPFGRNAFRFELLPVLRGIRDGSLPAGRVVCSIRDILVEKEDPDAYETRVIGLLNDYFDAILVHSDPGLIRLDETFSRISDVRPPLVYTGFVTPRPEPDARVAVRERLGLTENDRLIVASAGGGNVGYELLEATVKAVGLMDADNIHLHVSTGPYMDDEKTERLTALAGPRVRIMSFIDRFPDFLAAADLSISLAGYNTSMNLLAAGTPALVLPFAQNREQSRRAAVLAESGNFGILKEEDLDAPNLKKRIENALGSDRREPSSIDLNGAPNTAGWLESWMGDGR